jgi:leucyl-tRNA synthetase
MQYNTVVSALMKMLNTLEDAKLSSSRQCATTAPHLAECFSILLRVLYPGVPAPGYSSCGTSWAMRTCCGDLLDAALGRRG